MMIEGSIIQSPSALLAWRRQLDEPVVVVTGTFDIFQPGNLHVLRQASLLAKRVVVVVEPDDVAAAHSSPGRPQNVLETRAEMVACLRHVAAVTSVSRVEAGTLFAGLKPFTWVTAESQVQTEVYAEALLRSADCVVEIADQCGCFTEEIIAAMAGNRTPVRLPVQTEEPTPGPSKEGNKRGEEPTPGPILAGGLVTVNGCFDILHIGHLRFLNEARAMGNSLTVLINSDASVARYKGKTRPVFPVAFRMAALRALICVDDVVVFDGDDPLAEIGRLRPQIHVKGGSFEPDRVRTERDLVESWGGQLRCTSMVEGFSTTDYIRKALGLKDGKLSAR